MNTTLSMISTGVKETLSSTVSLKTREILTSLITNAYDTITSDVVSSNVSVLNLKARSNKAQSAGYEGGLRIHNYLIQGDVLRHHSNVATDSMVNWRGQGTV